MVSQTAIAVTALLQMLGKPLFVAQLKAYCSPAPMLGGNIFLLAMLMLIWDCNIIPKIFKKRSPWIFTAVEVLTTVFITEVIMNVGWCTYERIVYKLVSGMCCGRMWCEFGLMMFVTVLGAVASLCVTVEVVCPVLLKQSVFEVLGSLPIPERAGPLVNYIKDVRTYIMGAVFFAQLTREQRLLAVRAFELQVRNSTNRQGKPEEEEQENLEQETQDLQTDVNQTIEIPQGEPEEQSEEQHGNTQHETQDLADLQAYGNQIPEIPQEEQPQEQLEELSDEQHENHQHETQDLQNLQADGAETAEIPQDKASESQSEEQQENPEQVTQDLQDLLADGNQATEPDPAAESTA